ncbi:MAG: SGNH/GDSL hydrolase family protein [Thermoanaerobaculaceae bacterium]|jgi:lysophospholipase L1-like esterase
MRKVRTTLLLGLVAALAAGAAFAQVNFSQYEALGDSLTAGYSAGALTKFYQDYSYPELLAQQFGITSFQQPTISDPGIGSYGTVLELTALQVVNGSVVPVIGPTPGNPGQPINYALPVPYNNLGIPGANLGNLLTTTGNITNLLTGNINPNTIMYDLVLRDGQHTAIQQAIGAAPTFVTVWAGNNDVLAAAISGVAIVGVTLTPTAQFQQEYTTLIGALRQNLPNAAVVVGTVPDVTAIPFVTTIKPYIVNPANGTHIPLLGENGPLTEQDYVTLSASSLLAQGIGIPQAAGGTGLPLPEGSFDPTTGTLTAGVILRASEIALIQQSTSEINGVISTVAGQLGAKLVDFNAFFANIVENGVLVGGIRLEPTFLTGGLFGYDGIHPQRLGYAIVANEWINGINAAYGTNVPLVDLRPFLTGEGTLTTVSAKSAVFTSEAAISAIKLFAPNAVTDKLEPAHVVRHRLVALPVREESTVPDP